MVFNAFKNVIAWLARLTPNSFVPRLGEKLTGGRITVPDWAEFYLLGRFLFALALVITLPKSRLLVAIILIIQCSSIIYLLKIVFPVGARGLKDASRSLFFAFGHYLEIGFSMGYVYWYLNAFTQTPASQAPISLPKSVYFSFITMTTIGFGDITPNTDLARFVVTVHAIVALFMLATVIGLFLSLSTAGDGRSE
ncbi:Ion channel [Burkholderia sp. WP9]|uniref:potassium channel family protein n=1 Tax=Burkholderia sp. WP9 TaxID=1500263 RepID=UPI000896DF85|nr:potassium channel family protein [Burkholderia sp. WP9]SED25592.1 Ion channel [Burkholderia sp. WP9]